MRRETEESVWWGKVQCSAKRKEKDRWKGGEKEKRGGELSPPATDLGCSKNYQLPNLNYKN